MNNKCKICGIEISSRKTYCSSKCKEKNRYNQNVYIKECKICGEEFLALKGTVVCSQECSLKSQRTHSKQCPVCNNDFTSRGNGVYCSDVCYRMANNPKKGIELSKCTVCNNIYKKLKTDSRVVCSDECSSLLFKTYINSTLLSTFGTKDKTKIRRIINESKKNS